MARPVRILHLHSTFALGGKEARAVRLMNAFGAAAEHGVVSAMPEQLAAREAIDPAVRAFFPEDAPPLAGRPGLRRLYRLARYMKRFDLVLTYNWGAVDAVMARRLFAAGMRLPPLVHHEDGFNEDEALRLRPGRNLYRRLALSAAYRLVVPSRLLQHIAGEAWQQPASRIVRIANGIAVDRYGQSPSRTIPGLERRPGEVVIGTVAGLRTVKNLPRLVRAFAAAAGADSRLVMVGDGPDRERIMAEARRCGIADRLLLPGFLADPACWIGHFDVFALSSDSEQFPISVIEAMAAGLPVAATGVGDVPAMVAGSNRPLIVPAGDEASLASALEALVASPDLRQAIGGANRAKAAAEYDEGGMIRAYARLYGAAIARPDAFLKRNS